METGQVDFKYFAYSRKEMIGFVPSSSRRILDVGCGFGMFGELLKQEIPEAEVHGCELSQIALLEARKRLDLVFEGAFENVKVPVNWYYDCIVFNDVLEHMVDPWAALEKARTLLTSNGRVVASIPNMRHFPTIWKLVLYGRWDYVNQGILDRTHLRFFTKESIRTLFKESGYEIETLKGINRYMVNSPDEHKLWRYFKALQTIAPRFFSDMQWLQFAVVARPADNRW
jgi:2-polyprenyl-3-methyl-5-hydroxy-6-metoxy-1,4-benzoquinol methylase